MMVSFILQAGLIAMNRHVSVMIGWALGVVVTLPIFIVPSNIDITYITAAGALAGPAFTAVFLAADLWWSMRRRAAAIDPRITEPATPDPATTAGR